MKQNFVPLDEPEYEALSVKVVNGERLDVGVVERLAFTAEDRLKISANEDDELDNAEQALTVLFACHRAAPLSVSARDSLLSGALSFIDEAGDREEFDLAEKCFARLSAWSDAEPDNRPVALARANALVFLQIQYLDGWSEEETSALTRWLSKPKHPALKKYEALCELVRRYPDFPAMQAMRAWALSVWFSDAMYQENSARAEAWLKELREFAEAQRHNSMVALQCVKVYGEKIRYSLALDAAAQSVVEKSFAEMRRLTAEYSARHHALPAAADAPDYDWPHKPDDFEFACIDTLDKLGEYYAEHDDLAALQKCYATWLEFAGKLPPSVSLMLGRSLFLDHLSLLHGNARQFAQAEGMAAQLGEMESQLQALAAEHHDVEAVRECYADTLYNLAKNYGDDGLNKHERDIRAKIAALLKLSEACPDESVVRERYASALYNLNVWQEEQKQTAAAAATWELFYHYVLEHKVSEELTENAASEEMTLAGRDEISLAEARRHWQRVAELARRHPDYEALRGRLAAATFNLMDRLSGEGGPDAALEMYQWLRKMAEAAPADAQVALRLAKGAQNMIIDYNKAGRLDASEGVYASVSAVASRFPDDGEVAERWVKCARNLAVDYFHRKNYARVAELHRDVQHLSTHKNAAADIDALSKMAAMAKFQ